MSLDVSRDSSAHLARGGVVLGTAMVVFVAYALPFIGLLASLGLPFLTHTFRRHLWPDASTTRSMVWSLVAWVGVWLPGLLGVFTPVFAGSEGDGGMEVSTVWLVIPLCAPDSLDDVLLPALAAAVTCLVGLLGAVATRRGWLWVTAAWLAPWVHHLSSPGPPTSSSAERQDRHPQVVSRCESDSPGHLDRDSSEPGRGVNGTSSR